MLSSQEGYGITKRIVIAGSETPKVRRQVEAFIRAGEPFIVTGKKERARKLVARIQQQHPDTPVKIVTRWKRSDRWIALVGAEEKTALRLHTANGAEGGPVQSVVVTPTPTMADQGAAYREMMEEYYPQS